MSFGYTGYYPSQQNSKLKFPTSEDSSARDVQTGKVWDFSFETETTERDSTSRGTEQVVASQPSDPEMAALR